MLDKLFINKSDNIVLIQSGGHIGHIARLKSSCPSDFLIRFGKKIQKIFIMKFICLIK
jgi:hypothetical protein